MKRRLKISFLLLIFSVLLVGCDSTNKEENKNSKLEEKNSEIVKENDILVRFVETYVTDNENYGEVIDTNTDNIIVNFINTYQK